MLVQILSHEIVKDENGSYVVFNVLVSKPPQTFCVKKRYRDFLYLNELLCKYNYPKVNIPGKLWIHSDKKIYYRRLCLEQSLKAYLSSPAGDNNKVMEVFFGIKTDAHLARSPERLVKFSPIVESHYNDENVEPLILNLLLSSPKPKELILKKEIPLITNPISYSSKNNSNLSLVLPTSPRPETNHVNNLDASSSNDKMEVKNGWQSLIGGGIISCTAVVVLSLHVTFIMSGLIVVGVSGVTVWKVKQTN